MSAFIVSKEHVDALISAALYHAPKYPGDARFPASWFSEEPDPDEDRSAWYQACRRELTEETADATGLMLWEECRQSVAHRYPNDGDGMWPGPAGLTMAEVAEYRYQSNQIIAADPVKTLQALRCYEYQTCEHPDWESSEAKRCVEAIRDKMISRLTDDIDLWDIDERS
uniref:Uncharacterized protein n=1 Tax=viral metagenome TaxID=1070528 RepID=A0A6M3JER0_9ZZZZ